MLSVKRAALTAASAFALAALLSITSAVAQSQSPPEPSTEPAKPPVPAASAKPQTKGAPNESAPEGEAKDRRPQFLPPGMMIGPGPATALERFCDPRNTGFAGWRTNRFERALELTEDQKKKLEDYKTASAKALEGMVTGCTGKPAITPTGRLEAMEKRLAAQLEAVKLLRGAFEPFYASLSDEQKARLSVGVRDRGQRWDNDRW